MGLRPHCPAVFEGAVRLGQPRYVVSEDSRQAFIERIFVDKGKNLGGMKTCCMEYLNFFG